MPIKGLSDRRRLPRVGKIRLGIREPAKSGRGEYPKAVDYFVVHEDDSTPEKAAKAFHDVYGDEPRSLTVLFPTDEIDDWADPFYRAYSGSWGLTCRGDGETASARWDPHQDGPRPDGVEAGTWANTKTEKWLPREIPCPAEECPQQKANPPRCRRTMALQFLLPDVRGIGAWQIDTSSWNSIAQIRDEARLIKLALGRIRGVPLQLTLEPMQVVPPGGSVKKKRVYVMHLRQPDMTLNELLRQAAKLPEGALALPPPADDEEPEDFNLDLAPQGVPEVRPEQPCRLCGELIPVDDAARQLEHGEGLCTPHPEEEEHPPLIETRRVLQPGGEQPKLELVGGPTRGWTPANVGELLTKARELFSMTRAQVEAVSGPLVAGMTPTQLQDAWKRLFDSKVCKPRA